MKQKQLFIAFIATVLMALVCPQSTFAKDYLGHPYEGKMKKKVPMGEGVITIGNYTIEGTFNGNTISNATLDLKFLGYYKGTITFDESNDIMLQKDGCLTLIVYYDCELLKTDIHIDEPLKFTQSYFREGSAFKIPVKFSLTDSQGAFYNRGLTERILEVFPNIDVQGEATYIKMMVGVVEYSQSLIMKESFRPFLLNPRKTLEEYESRRNDIMREQQNIQTAYKAFIERYLEKSEEEGKSRSGAWKSAREAWLNSTERARLEEKLNNYNCLVAGNEWSGDISKKYQGLDLDIEFASDSRGCDLRSYCLKTPTGHSLFCKMKDSYDQHIIMPDGTKIRFSYNEIVLPNGIEMGSTNEDFIKTYKERTDERKIDKQIELLKSIQEHGIKYNGKLNAICIPNSKKMASDSIVNIVKTLSSQYPLSDTIEIQDDNLKMPYENFFYKAYEHLEGQYSSLDEFIENNYIKSWTNNKIVYPRDNCSGYYCSGVFRGIKEIKEDVKNRRNVIEARCKELEAAEKARKDKEEEEMEERSYYRSIVKVGKSFRSVCDYMQHSYVSFKLYSESATTKCYDVYYANTNVGFIHVSKKSGTVTKVYWIK